MVLKIISTKKRILEEMFVGRVRRSCIYLVIRLSKFVWAGANILHVSSTAIFFFSRLAAFLPSDSSFQSQTAQSDNIICCRFVVAAAAAVAMDGCTTSQMFRLELAFLSTY